MLHFPEAIHEYGAPIHYMTSTGERMHKMFAKRPGRRAQKRHKSFTGQIAFRMYDQLALNITEERFKRYSRSQENKSKTDADNTPSTYRGFSNATQWNLSKEDDGTYSINWNTRSKAGQLTLDESVLEFLSNHDDIPNECTFYTEYSRDGIQFRAHPNYQNEGPWFDWAFIKYKKTDYKDMNKHERKLKGKVYSKVPAKIYAFTEIEDEKYVVVHPCLFNGHQESVLTHKWMLHYSKKRNRVYDMVSVDSICSGCFIICDESVHKVFEVYNREEWAEKFNSV